MAAAAVLAAPGTYVLATTPAEIRLPQDEERFYVIVAGLALVLFLLAGTTLIVEQRSLRERATFDSLTGLPNRSEFERRSADLLTRGLERWDGAAEVGVVAGCVPRGLGRLIAAVDLESDGTVGIAETRLPGLHDHCLVQCSHTGLVLSAEAARQAAAFLRDGRFEHAGAPANV